MYPLQSNPSGYAFKTYRGVEYEVYFTRLEKFKDYFIEKLNTDEVYYFGIERVSVKTGGKRDIFIKRTIAFLLIDFFVSNPTAIVVFNYSNNDQRVNSRRKLFQEWYNEYSEHTVYQFYRLDFSNEVTVCALYKRNGVNFDNVRSGIKEAVSGIGKQFDENKQ